MKVIVDFCVIPMGVGVSLGSYIAACEKILTKAGLKTELHANGTNIEGEWDDCMHAVKECHETLHEMGVPRITSTLRIGTRVDRAQTMEDKIRSVEEKMR
ncbi:MAG: MTH1187 family thiamine-binding protein [Acidobacteria bacterium]|nr:MTH1187 family thiamine-binding protein [Acidobacteriota bacterium]